MRTFRSAAILALPFTVALFLTAAAGCKAKGPTLARVGHSAITETDLDLLGRVNPRLKPRLSTPAGKQKVIENYVEQELLYQESIRRGLSRSKAVKDKMALYEKIIIAQALLDQELDRRVRDYYQSHQDEFERIKVSHIMVRAASPEGKPAEKKVEKGKNVKEKEKEKGHPEAEALKLIEGLRARITDGGDFGAAAKEASEDERTKNSEGDLGYITIRDKRLERWGWLPVAEKAFALKVGEISDVIRSKEGFHIVKVTEEKKVQPYEEAEAGIKFRLQADIRSDLLGELKKKYKVEYAKAEGKKEDKSAPGQPSPGKEETQPSPITPPSIEENQQPSAPQ